MPRKTPRGRSCARDPRRPIRSSRAAREEKWRCVAATPRRQTRSEHEAAAARPRREVVDRAGLSSPQQSEGVLERAGFVLCLRRRERALCAAPGLGCQSAGALQERRGGGQTAPRLRPPGGLPELGSNVLVGASRSLSQMPRAPVGINPRIGRLAQRPVHQAPVVRRGRSVDRRAHQRMAKADSAVDLGSAQPDSAGSSATAGDSESPRPRAT